ncbi:MAG: M23 family metallopeptidase [Acetobacterium sp.]|nr:M23 family metallopeptidase [Acetobacterium sp.]
MDILNSEGTSVYAAASGTVTLSSWYGGYGKCVIIDHGNGYSTLYGHFSSVDVSEGQTVTQGQRIGGMGSTGSSTANHVHFEVRVNDEAQPINNYFSISTGDYI